MLFQGEEWAASTPFLYFTDHPDPELGRAVSEGRRREFPVLEGATEVPDPQDPRRSGARSSTGTRCNGVSTRSCSTGTGS